MLLLMLVTCLQLAATTASSEDPVVVEVITGPGQDSCGVYPGCREEGSWAVMEDCTREDIRVATNNFIIRLFE